MKKHSIALTWWTWFVWSFLVEKLIEDWHHVTLLKRSTSSLDKIQHLTDSSLVELFDIDWKKPLDHIFQRNAISVVMHLATAYGRKEEKGTEIIESAIQLPMKLLELAKKYNAEAFINTDSYFNQSIQLQDNIGIHAEAKRDFLKYAKHIIKDHHIKFWNVVMWHVYWPRDYEKKLVPWLIMQLLANKENIALVVWNNQRNFVYVKDIVRVYAMIIQYLEQMAQWAYEDFYDRTWEIVTVRQMANMLKKITWSTSQFAYWAYPDRENEIMEITPNLHTTIHNFGWKPEYTIEEWLTETVEYYKSLLKN